jgi:glycosyltransferase involved in cell wall biosynthesis
MVAYSQYFRDARIKRYVKSIESKGGIVDILALKEDPGKDFNRIGNSRIFHLTKKYQGSNGLLYVWSYLAYFVVCFFKLTFLSMKEKYHAIHVHNMPNFIVFSAIVPKLLGSIIILDIHDLMPANYMAKFDKSMLSSFIIKCLIFEQKISALFANHLLCADHMQKAYLENTCNISSNKITVIMNLPDEKIFNPQNIKSMIKERSNGTFKLVYHGTIAKRLGIDIMLRAIAKIGNEIPVHLSIYGSGDFLPQALSLAKDLGIDNKVYFSKSFFPVEMVPEMVCNMDLGIIANRKTLATDKFMMPVKLLEYVYLNIPVVSPKLKVIRAYFDEGMLQYFEPDNVDDLARCIVDLYRTPEKRELLVQNASKFYEKCSWKIQAREYLNLLPGFRG